MHLAVPAASISPNRTRCNLAVPTPSLKRLVIYLGFFAFECSSFEANCRMHLIETAVLKNPIRGQPFGFQAPLVPLFLILQA